MKKTLLAATLVFASANILASGFPVVDIVNGIQNGLMYVRQYEQLKNEIRAVEIAIDNVKNIKKLEWRDLSGLMNQMDDVSRRGKALSYTMKNADEKFNKIFPDIDKMQSNNNLQQKNQQNKAQLQTARDTIKNNILLLQKSAENFEKQQRTIEALKAQSKSSAGQMQALQVSSEIAAENVNQLQELKKIIAAQSNASAVFMSHQVTNEAQEDKAMQEVIDSFPKERYKPKINFNRMRFK